MKCAPGFSQGSKTDGGGDRKIERYLPTLATCSIGLWYQTTAVGVIIRKGGKGMWVEEINPMQRKSNVLEFSEGL